MTLEGVLHRFLDGSGRYVVSHIDLCSLHKGHLLHFPFESGAVRSKPDGNGLGGIKSGGGFERFQFRNDSHGHMLRDHQRSLKQRCGSVDSLQDYLLGSLFPTEIGHKKFHLTLLGGDKLGQNVVLGRIDIRVDVTVCLSAEAVGSEFLGTLQEGGVERINRRREGTGGLVSFEGSEGFLRVRGFLGEVTEVGKDPSEGGSKRQTDAPDQFIHRTGKGEGGNIGFGKRCDEGRHDATMEGDAKSFRRK